MIRGKYLRERKAIRVKRRMKLLLVLIIFYLLHKVLFGSYSLYESEANSSADINVAFYTLEDEYKTNVISLDDMIPGETRYCEFSVANFYKDDSGNSVISETDMEYYLKIRTTTNLPLEYKMYKNQAIDVENLANILDLQKQYIYLDNDNTIFQRLVLSSAFDDAGKIGDTEDNWYTDYGKYYHDVEGYDSYILEVFFPAQYNTIDYQNIIDCIEISVDSRQIMKDETANT